jgi:hypothetical protein
MLKAIKTKAKHAINVVHAHLRERAKSKNRSPHWEATAKAFVKSNPTCAACGSKVRLQVHHRAPFHLHPELELEPKNLIVLCMGTTECHLQIGHGGLFSAFNAKVAEDAALLLAHLGDSVLWEDIVRRARNFRQR